MTLSLQSIRIRTGSSDEEGRLVMDEGLLVAILIQLSADHPRSRDQYAPNTKPETALEASYAMTDTTRLPQNEAESTT